MLALNTHYILNIYYTYYIKSNSIDLHSGIPFALIVPLKRFQPVALHADKCEDNMGA